MIPLTGDNYAIEVENFNGLVIIDFWAPWCGPCSAFSPFFEELEAQYKENTTIKFAKVNIDNNQDLAMMFGIRSIPTVIFIKNKEIVDRIMGISPREEYYACIRKYTTGE